MQPRILTLACVVLLGAATHLELCHKAICVVTSRGFIQNNLCYSRLPVLSHLSTLTDISYFSRKGSCSNRNESVFECMQTIELGVPESYEKLVNIFYSGDSNTNAVHLWLTYLQPKQLRPARTGKMRKQCSSFGVVSSTHPNKARPRAETGQTRHG